MSLIQDALKRKTEEQHTLPSQPTPSAPPVSPSPVQTKPVSELPPPNSPERKLFIFLLVAFILILLVIGISVYFVLQTSHEESSTKPVVETVLPTAIAETIKPIEPPPTAAKKSKSSWPELNFSGTASAGSQRLAIINGRMLSTGSSVLGVTVLEIGKTQVLVEYKGEKRVLQVGGQ